MAKKEGATYCTRCNTNFYSSGEFASHFTNGRCDENIQIRKKRKKTKARESFLQQKNEELKNLNLSDLKKVALADYGVSSYSVEKQETLDFVKNKFFFNSKTMRTFELPIVQDKAKNFGIEIKEKSKGDLILDIQEYCNDKLEEIDEMSNSQLFAFAKEEGLKIKEKKKEALIKEIMQCLTDKE